jgi:hypothetical protein
MPKLTFFMIVTPRDYPIAFYTIRPLVLLVQSKPCFGAIIYCNGLSKEQVNDILKMSKGSGRIVVKDNYEYLQSVKSSIKVGTVDSVTRQLGGMEVRQGFYEPAGEIWSRELVHLSADFVTIIDADFEILDDEFVKIMATQIASEPRVAFYSTDYSDDCTIFESYAQEEAKIAKRWHTWFCIYRRTALDRFHNFWYFEERNGKLPFKYDRSAMLQKILIERYGYVGASLSENYSGQFLHYGAFGKNRSLKGMRLKFYRIIRIGRHNGWIHKHHLAPIAELTRKLSNSMWSTLRLARFDAERSRFPFEND